MIRRTLAVLLALVALAGLAACKTTDTPTPESTAVKFIQAKADGDEKTMCRLADREVGDCTTKAALDLAKKPRATETFTNDATGSTAVLVTLTTTKDPAPQQWAVEVKKDGKVTEWEDVSGSPSTRATVAEALGWSE